VLVVPGVSGKTLTPALPERTKHPTYAHVVNITSSTDLFIVISDHWLCTNSRRANCPPSYCSSLRRKSPAESVSPGLIPAYPGDAG